MKTPAEAARAPEGRTVEQLPDDFPGRFHQPAGCVEFNDQTGGVGPGGLGQAPVDVPYRDRGDGLVGQMKPDDGAGRVRESFRYTPQAQDEYQQ